MTDLDGAVRQQTEYKRTELKLGYGAHKGYWIGLGDVVTENSQCKKCKGRGQINGEECRTCGGAGRKDEKKVAILYQMGPDLIQEEWVNYKLSGPGKLKNGDPKSPTTLYNRIRNFSGGLTVEAEMSAWYKSLEKPIKMPIEMIITESDKGSGLVISSVRKVDPKSKQETPAEALGFNDDDFAGLAR